MANAKLKCKGCGAYYRVKPDHESFRRWCSDDCALVIVSNRTEKQREQTRKQLKRQKSKELKVKKAKDAKRKRDFYENDLKTRKAAAKLACHRYIKARDKGLPCICCNRPLNGKIDAGHFLESGNNPLIRYHEDNIHAQSVYCNQFKGGNPKGYEENLRLKIGDERVEWLFTQKGGTVKRTCEDYKSIELHYKQKLKDLD